MFCGTSILKAFWMDFGRVLGGQNPWFLHFFREKTQAKNKMIFGRLKNRILRPKNGFTPNFWAGWAVCAAPGEGTKGWGKALEVGIWSLILKHFLFHWTPPRGGHRRLPICVQECWGTAMHWRLASAGLHCWRHMGKWKPTFWLQFAQTLLWI